MQLNICLCAASLTKMTSLYGSFWLILQNFTYKQHCPVNFVPFCKDPLTVTLQASLICPVCKSSSATQWRNKKLSLWALHMFWKMKKGDAQKPCSTLHVVRWAYRFQGHVPHASFIHVTQLPALSIPTICVFSYKYNWTIRFSQGPTSSNVLLGQGSEKAFTECLGVSNVFPSAALVHIWYSTYHHAMASKPLGEVK